MSSSSLASSPCHTEGSRRYWLADGAGECSVKSRRCDGMADGPAMVFDWLFSLPFIAFNINPRCSRCQARNYVNSKPTHYRKFGDGPDLSHRSLQAKLRARMK